jgi:TatD DNase family protein
MLVDSHCHLDFPEFQDDFEEVLSRAKAAGVSTLLTISTTISKFPNIVKTASRSPDIYCSVGIHPSHAKEEALCSAEKLAALCSGLKVVGIGETGLDYHYPDTDKEIQKLKFIEHIKAAQITGLPLIIHTRDADADTIAVLKEHMLNRPFKALIHCFTASEWLAQECLQMGMYISVSGIISFKNATSLHEAVKNIPIEKLLIETDSPYLAPVPYRGKRNEPAFVKNVAVALAILKGLSYDEVIEKTGNNFYNLFSKVMRS